MRRIQLLVLSAALLVAADTPKPQGTADPLQGKWYIVHLDRPGEKKGREAFDFRDTEFTLTFDRGTVTSMHQGKVLWQGAYRLDPGVNPNAIEITRRSGPFKQGIYQQTGDTLKLCLDYPASPRPTRFSAGKDSRAEVMVFRRMKPGS